MTCSSCKYLKESKKYEGALCGAIYYCEKLKKNVDGSNNCCDKYDKSYLRNNYECNKIYEDGVNFSDDDKSVSYYIIVLIFIILFGLFITFLNNLGM